MVKSLIANIATSIFPGIQFSMAGNAGGKPAVYLTFDDGPHPESTPRILELLAKHNALATFFCMGRNAEKYPAVYDSILTAGHAVGNHSYSHPNGWTTSTGRYVADVDHAAAIISSNLFRPPYGRITPGQYRQLKKRYNIIMWTRQYADYRPVFDPATSNLSVIRPGDILVMHDSLKSAEKTLPLLEKLLTLTSAKYSYKAIPCP